MSWTKNKSFSEREFLGHFAPGSESSRERIGQGPIGPLATMSMLLLFSFVGVVNFVCILDY